MENTFEQKVAYVATSYYRRFDDAEEGFNSENDYPTVLRAIFQRHDMAGAVALAAFNGDVEIKTDNGKRWIEESYNVLTSVFGEPEPLVEAKPVAETKPAKKTATKKTASE